MDSAWIAPYGAGTQPIAVVSMLPKYSFPPKASTLVTGP